MDRFTGQIYFYRVFDVASAIDLAMASERLSNIAEAKPFKLRKTSRAMVIEEAPVALSMGGWEQEIGGRHYPVTAYGKLWGFGALSINLCINIQNAISFNELLTMAQLLSNEDTFHELAVERCKLLTKDLGKAVIKGSELSEFYEDYLIFNMDAQGMKNEQVDALLKSDIIHQLILTEKETNLSNQMRENIQSNVFQYSKDDFVILDWNSAFICSEGDGADIADVIEFGLCQMMEMRYYDDLLDRKLSGLYRDIQTIESSTFSRRYAKLAQEAALMYIEISQVVERIENSMKVIGDFYYAKIFRQALNRFRFSDWRQSVDQKLKNLADVSGMFMGEVNAKRSHLMEMIVIVLISVEVVTFLVRLVSNL